MNQDSCCFCPINAPSDISAWEPVPVLGGLVGPFYSRDFEPRESLFCHISCAITARGVNICSRGREHIPYKVLEDIQGIGWTAISRYHPVHPGEFANYFSDQLQAEYRRGQRITCALCQQRGALLGCAIKGCDNSYHFYCSRWGCVVIAAPLMREGKRLRPMYVLFCPEHAAPSTPTAPETPIPAEGELVVHVNDVSRELLDYYGEIPNCGIAFPVHVIIKTKPGANRDPETSEKVVEFIDGELLQFNSILTPIPDELPIIFTQDEVVSDSGSDKKESQLPANAENSSDSENSTKSTPQTMHRVTERDETAMTSRNLNHLPVRKSSSSGTQQHHAIPRKNRITNTNDNVSSSGEASTNYSRKHVQDANTRSAPSNHLRGRPQNRIKTEERMMKSMENTRNSTTFPPNDVGVSYMIPKKKRTLPEGNPDIISRFLNVDNGIERPDTLHFKSHTPRTAINPRSRVHESASSVVQTSQRYAIPKKMRNARIDDEDEMINAISYTYRHDEQVSSASSRRNPEISRLEARRLRELGKDHIVCDIPDSPRSKLEVRRLEELDRPEIITGNMDAELATVTQVLHTIELDGSNKGNAEEIETGHKTALSHIYELASKMTIVNNDIFSSCPANDTEIDRARSKAITFQKRGKNGLPIKIARTGIVLLHQDSHGFGKFNSLFRDSDREVWVEKHQQFWTLPEQFESMEDLYVHGKNILDDLDSKSVMVVGILLAEFSEYLGGERYDLRLQVLLENGENDLKQPSQEGACCVLGDFCTYDGSSPENDELGKLIILKKGSIGYSEVIRKCDLQDTECSHLCAIMLVPTCKEELQLVS